MSISRSMVGSIHAGSVVERTARSYRDVCHQQRGCGDQGIVLSISRHRRRLERNATRPAFRRDHGSERQHPSVPWPGQPQQTIQDGAHVPDTPTVSRTALYNVFVYNYQGQVGNNFRVYFREQATQDLYGGLAPCTDTTTRPEVDGITCPMTGTPTLPLFPPTAPTLSADHSLIGFTGGCKGRPRRLNLRIWTMLNLRQAGPRMGVVTVTVCERVAMFSCGAEPYSRVVASQAPAQRHGAESRGLRL